MVMWQIYNCLHIFLDQPTTASMELVNSQITPLAFTFCKTMYRSKFKGDFSSQMHRSIKSILVHLKESEIELLEEKEFSYEFVSYIEKQLMCKEFIMPSHQINRIQLKRSTGDNNLFLYIHQPGMFYSEELWVDYPNTQFRVIGEVYEENKNVRIQRTSYDITTNPHMPCTVSSYDKCIRKEVIQIYNNTLGCTYPIQRYFLCKMFQSLKVFMIISISEIYDINIFRELFGVKICESDEIELLKNFTNTAMKSQVCPLPCILNYVELDNLPGTVIYK